MKWLIINSLQNKLLIHNLLPTFQNRDCNIFSWISLGFFYRKLWPTHSWSIFFTEFIIFLTENCYRHTIGHNLWLIFENFDRHIFLRFFWPHFTLFVTEKSVGIFSWSNFIHLNSVTRIFLTENIGRKFGLKFLWLIFSVTISIDRKWISTNDFSTDYFRSKYRSQSANAVAISKKIGRKVGHKISLLP